jgi:hypothetical protein
MPTTRRQRAKEAEGAEAVEAPKRRVTPRGRKETKPEAVPQRDLDKAALVEMLVPRLRDLFPDTPEEDLKGVLDTTIESMYPIPDLSGLLELEDEQDGILEGAAGLLAPPEATPVAEPEPGSAAAAAAAAAPPPEKPATPTPEAAPTPLAEILATKVGITPEAIQRVIEVEAAVPMEASQASVARSYGSMTEEEEPAAGVVSDKTTTTTYYPINDVNFPESLSERFNMIFPSLGEAPIPFSELKDAAKRGREFYAFTVADVAPGAVLGSNYTLLTGDPKKVAVAGILALYPTASGIATGKILALGTRKDLIPKEGLDEYLAIALRSLAQNLQSRFGPTAILRYARKQMFTEPDYTSTVRTLAAVGIPYSSFTPEGQQALFKLKGSAAKDPVDISQVKRLADGTLSYEYLEEGTGATKTFAPSAIDKVYVLGRRGVQLSPTVEFVGAVGPVLAPTGAEATITIPDPILLSDPERTAPRRGGRRKTARRR